MSLNLRMTRFPLAVPGSALSSATCRKLTPPAMPYRSRLFIASTGSCKTGADHQHPSFNRRGDMILFSNPDENGIAQVCTIDLGQIMKDW